jgi:GH24 family phage-related lysozyme (muramidase)
VNLSEVGAQTLAQREGTRLKPYNDSKGYCTTGIGHLVAYHRCTAADIAQWTLLSKEAAVELFRKDLAASYEPAVNDFVKVPLTQNQYDALVSFVYNVGVNGFKNSTLLKRLNAGDYEGAATAFMMWNKPPEIIGRRRGEMNQFRTPYGNQQPVSQRIAPNLLLRGPSTKFAKAEWLHPVFRMRLEQTYDQVPFTNKSGGRSRQRQAELYSLFKRGKGNPANPPGTGWHEYDEDGSTLAQAADIHPKSGFTYAQLHAAAKRFDLHFPVKSEDWHIQPIEAKSSRRVEGQGLGPVPAYWNPEPLEEDEEMGKPYIFGVKSDDPTLDGIWEMGGDEVARHIPSFDDVEALKKAGRIDVGPMTAAWLERHLRITPPLGNLPEVPKVKK